MSGNEVKKFKKGEFLFREGETTNTLYFIQSGRVSLNIARSGRKIEFNVASNGNMVGEQSVVGRCKQMCNAEALTEVRVLAVGTEMIQGQLEKSPPGIGVFVKAMSEEVRRLRDSVKGHSLETDTSPCPQRFIPRLFSILNLVVRRVGKPEGEKGLLISWNTLKIHTSRMFLESHQRMEQVLKILLKHKFATLHYELNEDDEKELDRIVLRDLDMIELFGEFYQYNYFRAGRSEVIYVDPLAYKVVKAIVELTRELETDQRGVTFVEFKKLKEDLHTQYKLEFKDVHFSLLEKKGLFFKRVKKDEEAYLSFDALEFSHTLMFWKFIREMDRWNEIGHVDVDDDLDAEVEEAKAICSQCEFEYTDDSKFCSNCGHKVAA